MHDKRISDRYDRDWRTCWRCGRKIVPWGDNRVVTNDRHIDCPERVETEALPI